MIASKFMTIFQLFICLYLEYYKLFGLQLFLLLFPRFRFIHILLAEYIIVNEITSYRYIPLLLLQIIQVPVYYWFLFGIGFDLLSIGYISNYFLYFLRVVLIHNLFFMNQEQEREHSQKLSTSVLLILIGGFLPCLLFVIVIQYSKFSFYFIVCCMFHIFVALQSPTEIVSNGFAMASFIIWKKYSQFNLVEHEKKLNKKLHIKFSGITSCII
jgi:hypothetical protein